MNLKVPPCEPGRGADEPDVVRVPLTHVKVFGWYDNEMGSYTYRLGELTGSAPPAECDAARGRAAAVPAVGRGPTPHKPRSATGPRQRPTRVRGPTDLCPWRPCT